MTSTTSTDVESEEHPLIERWKFYYYEADKSENWLQRHQELLTFTSVENVWQAVHHTIPPSNLRWGNGYVLFQSHIEPMWEDEHNKDSGRIVLQFQKEDSAEIRNTAWYLILLTVVGGHWNLDVNNEYKQLADQRGFTNPEALELASHFIHGLIYDHRLKPGDRISVWTKTCTNYKVILLIMLKICELTHHKFDLHFQRGEEARAARSNSRPTSFIMLPTNPAQKVTVLQKY